MRLCKPGRPGTHCIAQVDVELREALPQLHVPAPTPGSRFSSNFHFLVTSDIEYLDVVRVFFLSVLRHYPAQVCLQFALLLPQPPEYSCKSGCSWSSFSAVEMLEIA